MLAAELERYLADLIDYDAFSGVVLIAQDGVPTFTRAYGLARIPQRQTCSSSLPHFSSIRSLIRNIRASCSAARRLPNEDQVSIMRMASFGKN